ncbi:MAG: site-specific DNA-methyltransferase [Chloroflexi bacterium]|nr:site-specific DNA-methyltransferase [Chloroflexota bacterium]
MAAVTLRSRAVYIGDNLPFLRALPDASIHLIATDPPFNKDRDFGEAFRDRWSWERDARDEWIDEIKGACPALWSLIETAGQIADARMSAYLCWLGIRLLEMRRVLRGDGSLYLHIDHSTQAYVKLALDAVFGPENFRNEIVWHYKTGGLSKRWFGRKHDTILFYSKSDAYVFYPQQEKSYLSHKYGFSNISLDEDDDGVYRMAAMRDVWDIPALRGNQAEATGYPTQKPLALYERIIRASSAEGDIVLDPFCGSGTTVVAAEWLGRRWLAADLWDGAYECLASRLEAEGLAASKDIKRLADVSMNS